MSKTVDMELKKAFGELQDMMVDTKQKLKLADVQIDSLKRAKQRADLTSLEIKSLPVDTNTYESVGRMFILTPVSTVLDNLSTKSVHCSEKIKTLEESKTYLEKNLRESKSSLREMIQQRKDCPEK